MTVPLAELVWPADRLGEALAALAVRDGLAGSLGSIGEPPAGVVSAGRGALGDWLETAAGRLDVEAQAVEAPYDQVDNLLTRAGPALLLLPGTTPANSTPPAGRNGVARPCGPAGNPHPGAGPGCLVLLRGRGRRVVLLAPDRTAVAVPLEEVRAALCREAETPVLGHVERVLKDLDLAGRRRGRARRALLRQFLAARPVIGCWQLRVAGRAGLAAQARESRLGRLLLTLLAAHLCEYTLWILSWGVLGGLALRGRLDSGWLLAWFLLLFSLIPFRLLTTYSGGLLSLRAGTLLKRRLLAGTLRLDPDEVRHLGAGQLLGRVMEAEVVEMTAVTGGFLAVTAALELVVVGILFGVAGGSPGHVVLLVAAALLTALLGVRYHRRLRQWTRERLDMTNDLVERMVGHRTRLAQQPRARWNDGEDQRLETYLGTSRHVDGLAAVLHVAVPRGWLMAGLLALVPAFVFGARTPVGLAVSVGGTLLAYKALRNLAEGVERLTMAAVACERVSPFWRAASRQEPAGHSSIVAPSPPPLGAADQRPVLEAHDLVFHYGEQRAAVLRQIDAAIYPGDRVLLEGGSGSGKSTLAALLAGSRVPSAGLLLLQGLDRQTLGASGWRRRVVLAPQFHENHVLIGSFAFNILMGRGWPPQQADLDEAERLCRALDLGPLLDHMPAGLFQLVGETGWQLSHGEKSRLYIARALLQRPDVVVLDESFAALDPPTLRRTLRVVLENSPTLVVIAHP